MPRRTGPPSATTARQGTPQPPSPDLVLLGGKVFTADPARRYAQALAITGDRVVAVGTTNDIAAMADAHTRRIDLAGRVVIPGINDAHVHHTPDPRATLLPITSMEPTWEDILDMVAT